MHKPSYRVHLSFDSERQMFMATAPELPHCASKHVVVFGDGREEDVRALLRDLRERDGGATARDVGGEVVESKAEFAMRIVRSRREDARGEAVQHVAENDHDFVRARRFVGLDAPLRGCLSRRVPRHDDVAERALSERARRRNRRRLGRRRRRNLGRFVSIQLRRRIRGILLALGNLLRRGAGFGFEEVVE